MTDNKLVSSYCNIQVRMETGESNNKINKGNKDIIDTKEGKQVQVNKWRVY